MNYEILQRALDAVRDRWPDAKPRCGLILGSGWSEVVSAFKVRDSMAYGDIPGLGKPGVAGHSGKLAWAELAGVETFVWQGRRHWYEGEGWTPVAIPPYVLVKLGATTAVLTNAAGGIKPGMKAGDLMLLTDHINNLPSNPLIGPHHTVWGPRFPDQTRVYSPELRNALHAAATSLHQKLHEGVYLASTGPTYETPAEIRRYQQAGADAVGMSTIPEAILLSAAGVRVLALSCISNLAAGISPTPLTHEEVTEATNAAMPRMKALLTEFWKML